MWKFKVAFEFPESSSMMVETGDHLSMEAPHKLDLTRLRGLEAAKSAAIGRSRQLLSEYQALGVKEANARKELKSLDEHLAHYSRHGSSTDQNAGATPSGPVLRNSVAKKKDDLERIREDIRIKEAEMHAASEEASTASQLFENCRKYAEGVTNGE
ncbi:hypothetical protein ACIQUB_08335 [Rhizobium sp. NPDC090275]|uniref:hypothetical protein n=1 Tax=Rhizobium sp. NPDC090275 TaxID=3364498 RepID=UPI00383B6171